ncbi:NYN domain-containing protein [Salinibacterium sp. UTAS2018]|uniref:NYN domain-containing protein n=1 Tax=Salinibacterium sp. UTAS2018 TaxID=2508880 RepID=UPI0010094B04|nr:NYN domain-containing protein [Salinibacterium sp. UTAS2018]QAV69290.1 NYN domain-containing protein [Salinibacterium sp. UTAS2018]
MPSEGRVAVYIDFDNIVISRYNQKHGDGQFQRDKARAHNARRTTTSAVGTKLDAARVDVEAILEYASSFGTVALSRAYADWSVPVNAAHQKHFVNKSVELVQLFPLTGQMKNGADIRLAVDVMEDLFHLRDLTHVVIIAGDSDYVALAQRARKLGRVVVGVGVAGGTSHALTASCDTFADYDALPGISNKTTTPPPSKTPVATVPVKKAVQPSKQKTPAPAVKAGAVAPAATTKTTKTTKTQTTKKGLSATAAPKKAPTTVTAEPKSAAVQSAAVSPKVNPLTALVRAMRAIQKTDGDWVNNSAVREQLRRMHPALKESSLALRDHQQLIQKHPSNIETRQKAGVMQLRLRSNVPHPK